ncbi:LacI family DNA-binding transcriptional regulator [Pectobacterium brasiliense]|uniref:LacI family DNA-binding transcriptional regulator n=1 Tax=Pectobacterium brasiliense TaxID=180957 RepID=UPI000580A9D7|nr:LacI family DNA-binding transcriptional regulator [Pectobacterium brasiliense]KHS70275.1 LacI family transcriptional regulator [Pectobacterium brasiliense]
MATITDIAQKAGVAASTVSRVLNNDPSLSITKEKRQLIKKIAHELAYLSPTQRKQQKKRLENSLVVRSHFKMDNDNLLNLAVVHFLTPSEELNDPYFTAMRIGIENRCHHFNISLRNLFTTNLSSNSQTLAQAQAIICVGHFSDSDIALISSLNKNLIFIDSAPLDKQCDAVLFDREAAAREVLHYIVNSGAQRPAFIGNNESRLHVFQEVTQKHGIYDESRCKVSQLFCIESGYQAMNELLQQKEWPDVVFAATDIIAIGVYRAIQEKGIAIPKQIKVIGMNDIPTAQHLNPSLTTMRLYPTEMGEAAVDLFLELVAGRYYKKHVQIGYEMVWRESFTLNDTLL